MTAKRSVSKGDNLRYFETSLWYNAARQTKALTYESVNVSNNAKYFVKLQYTADIQP